MRGKLTLTDGRLATFRRVGSSCSYVLAKCKVRSLASHWPEPSPADRAPAWMGDAASAAPAPTADAPSGAEAEAEA